MPNWVYNSLSVNGDVDELKKFTEQVARSYETRHYNWETKENEVKTTENVGFSFWNIVAPDESILDEYWGKADLTAGKDNWYDWNCKNWGTKWDAAEVNIEQHSPRHLEVHFHTAWSPPYPVIEEASRQHPTLNFSLHWEEEQGFGAEVEVNDGVFVEVRSWDTPESHADYAERGNEDGCLCATGDGEEYWFDDCPGRTTVTIEQAVQMFEDESARL